MTAPSAPVLGTPNQGTTGATTYTLASHVADDVHFLATETNVTGGLADPSGGWVDIPGSPRAQGSNVVAITAWWLRSTSGSTTNPQVPATSDHQVGIPIMVRGCQTTGDPWTASSNDGQATGTTGRVFDPGTGNSITTVDPDCLVLYLIACSADIGTDNASNFNTPSGLTGFTILDQHNTTGGNGGSVIVAYGFKATAGAVGTLTWDFGTTSAWSGIALAIPGASAPTNVNGDAASSSTGTLSADGLVGAVAAAALAATATLAAAGVVGTSGDATRTETATVSAAGTVGTASGASVAGTATLNATGAVGTASGASIAATGALTAAGSVVSGLSSSATISETAALTSSGVVGKATGSTLAATDTITAAGAVGKVSGASVAATDALTATGQVGKVGTASVAATGTITAAGTVVAGGTGSAAVTETATITAAGTLGKNAGATATYVVALTTTGVVGKTTTAPLAATATLTAAGSVGGAAGPVHDLDARPDGPTHVAVADDPQFTAAPDAPQFRSIPTVPPVLLSALGSHT